MPRLSWRAVPGPEGPALLAARGRDAALGTVVVVLTVGVFAAVVLSEVLIGVLKGVYERPRPPESLVVTTGASFPSGHAVAASATVVAAVIAMVPPERRRAWWALAAVAFSILMGLSRAYLGTHWLSDAVAGILLGISCAVVTALIVGQIQRSVEGRQGAVWK
jgi:undecaprenyl-diphosphatase